MADNSSVSRRFGIENRPYIVEIPQSPTSQFIGSNNRTILPAIRDSSGSRLSNIVDLNNTQQKLKQLESRLQATEVSNRALIEEVIRLQNELALTLRRSLDTINEEKNARQILENSVKFQNDSFLQLNGRLKRTEDILQEDRNAMQSMIAYTRNLEQSLVYAQKDLFSRREFQSKRLDELKIQIDDLQFSKDNLERNANSLLEEIKNIKNKVDYEALNLNSIGGDLRNKTRRLEDETRQHVDLMRKQQDTLSITENNISSLRAQLENKINEVRDMNIDLKNKIDSDREDRRTFDQQINVKLSDLHAMINEEKLKYNESIRVLDTFKREFHLILDNERNRTQALVADIKESTFSLSIEKIEKAKEEFNLKLREAERLINEEAESRNKYHQNLKDQMEVKIDNLKRVIDDEITSHRNESRTNASKTAESIKKLNEGLNLIELQHEERSRRIEKVLNAEISSRKADEKDLGDRFDSYNEKFTAGMQSFQTTLSNITSKLNETREQYVTRKDFELSEKKQNELQADIMQNNLKIGNLRETLNQHNTIQEQHTTKLKDFNERMSQIENIKITLINDRIDKLPTKEDLNNFKIESNEKLTEEMQRIIKQNDIQHSEIKKTNDDKLEELNTQLNSFNNKLTQKLNDTDKLVRDQIALQNEYQLKNMTTLSELDNKITNQNFDQRTKASELESQIEEKDHKIEELEQKLNDFNQNLNSTINSLGSYISNYISETESKEATNDEKFNEFKKNSLEQLKKLCEQNVSREEFEEFVSRYENEPIWPKIKSDIDKNLDNNLTTFAKFLKEETRKAIKDYDEKNQENLQNIKQTLQNSFDQSKRSNETKLIELQDEIKSDIDTLKRDLRNLKDEQKSMLNQKLESQNSEINKLNTKIEKVETKLNDMKTPSLDNDPPKRLSKTKISTGNENSLITNDHKLNPKNVSFKAEPILKKSISQKSDVRPTFSSDEDSEEENPFNYKKYEDNSEAKPSWKKDQKDQEKFDDSKTDFDKWFKPQSPSSDDLNIKEKNNFREETTKKITRSSKLNNFKQF